ncbi:MAG: DNA cytosine methyltransferase [Dehalococcoidia bacterium]
MSLFSGCGGLDLGLEQAGFRVVFATDLEQRCEDSYKANFPVTPFLRGHVNKLTRELMAEVSRGETDQEIALLAGGPPCPAFSKSRFYRLEKPRALDDQLAEETLEGYLNVLQTLRPRAFLLENVFGFAYGVHRAALKYVLETASSLGYTCNWQVLNAADYGVPQIRERFVLVGMQGQAFSFPQATHSKSPVADLFGPILLPWRTAGQAIGDLDTDDNADDKGHFAGGQYHQLLEQVPPGDNYLYFTDKRRHPNPVFKWRSRYWSFLLKLSPELPSWTIQARRSNNMGPFHWRNRILRIEEVKSIQTFPREWKLSGTVEQQWRQLGNAVPPLLAAKLGEALVHQLGFREAATNATRTQTTTPTVSQRVLAGAG